MNKKDIRKELKIRRDNIAYEEWLLNSQIIENKILKSKVYKECRKLFVYTDFHNEVEMMFLIEQALLDRKEIYLPKVLEGFEESRMDFFRITSTFELVDGYLGIKEPISDNSKVFDYESSKDEKMLMLVPGVAFDNLGNRLGYGKGYYDNYLKDKPNILTVGVCFSLQLVDSFPTSDIDVRLNHILTEKTPTEEIDRYTFFD